MGPVFSPYSACTRCEGPARPWPQALVLSSVKLPFRIPVECLTLPVPTPEGSARAPWQGEGASLQALSPAHPQGGPQGGGLLSTSCHGLCLICQVAATTHLAALPLSLSLLPPRPPHLGLSPTSLGAAWSASWTTPTQPGGVWSEQTKYRDTHGGPAGGYNL